MREKRLLEVLKEINTMECNTEEDKTKRDDLIAKLFEIKKVSGYRSVRADDSNSDELYKTEYTNDITEYKWKYQQLNKIYNNCVYSYCSVDKKIKGIEYKYNLEINDVFSIMLKELTNLRKFDFGDGDIGEAKLVKYISKKINGSCKNEFNKINKLYIENNAKAESYDRILEEPTTQERKLFIGDPYNSYNNLFNVEFNYIENSYKRYNKENDEKVYLCWAKLFWDDEKILSDKNLNIIYEKEVINKFKNWREWATNKQQDKIEKLINAYEDGIELCHFWNGRYVLNKKEVGQVLFPNRKNNSNKDIDNFIKSLKNRFKKYLINNRKIKFLDRVA